MRVDLCTVILESERRVNHQRWFEANEDSAPLLGAFLSLRNDDQFVWLRTGGDSQTEDVARPHVVSSVTRRLESSPGSTVSKAEDLAALRQSAVIELRQYRIAAGARRRFTDFLLQRTLEPQRACGMAFFGPFDDLDDENVATWFRGFPSLRERDLRKAAFYQGRLWLEELEAEAFSMIEDYSNTMLVTPA